MSEGWRKGVKKRKAFLCAVIAASVIGCGFDKTAWAQGRQDVSPAEAISGNDAAGGEIKGTDSVPGNSAAEPDTETSREKETEASVIEQQEDQTAIRENQTAVQEDQTVLQEGQTAVQENEARGGEMVSLLIPQKVEIIINPWELDGRRQVYSEWYTIKNCGETAGVLTLSNLMCRPLDGDVDVRTDSGGLHEGEGKNIYLEMAFDDGMTIGLSEEERRYEIPFEPGEEVSFTFCGEVNENAAEGWQESGVAVSIFYAWSSQQEYTADRQNLQ